MMARCLRLLLIGSMLAAKLAAQEVVGVPADRIVAIVGDTPIALTRLQQQELTFVTQGGVLPTDPAELAALRRDLLLGLVDQELLVQAAERDTTVQVTDEEVQEAVEQTVRNIREGYPSMLDLERDLRTAGFRDLDDYRLYLAEQQRRQFLQEAILQELQTRGEIEELPPTDEELREFYEARKEQFGRRPATVSFRQIAVFSHPDSGAIVEALTEADSIRRELEEGADFTEMARLHSDDPTTRDAGGGLGWFRRGQGMEREFEDAAFRLQPGVVSYPVYTSFGFHLIEVLRAEPASVQARHILIAPTITAENQLQARARADSAMRLLEAGTPYDSVVTLYHEPDEERYLADVPRDRLPQEYQDAIATAQVGDFVGPLETDRGNGRLVYTVIELQDMRPEGLVSFDDVRDQLRSNLAQQNGIERFLQKLRDATYIEIRL
ncbi:MAG: peptidylprolyl isomerase [Gemmatimonadota bacterium]|nr:MAG: peptidylprolyl isomerase [Gemmatimonadota bacterium]